MRDTTKPTVKSKTITRTLFIAIIALFLPTAQAGETEDILTFIQSFEPTVKNIPEGFYLEKTGEGMGIKEYAGTFGRYDVTFSILEGKMLSFYFSLKKGYNDSSIQNDFRVLKKVFDRLVTQYNLQNHIRIEDNPANVEKFDDYGKTVFSHEKVYHANPETNYADLMMIVRYHLGFRQYWKGELSSETGSATYFNVTYEKRIRTKYEKYQKDHGN